MNVKSYFVWFVYFLFLLLVSAGGICLPVVCSCSIADLTYVLHNTQTKELQSQVLMNLISLHEWKFNHENGFDEYRLLNRINVGPNTFVVHWFVRIGRICDVKNVKKSFVASGVQGILVFICCFGAQKETWTKLRHQMRKFLSVGLTSLHIKAEKWNQLLERGRLPE